MTDLNQELISTEAGHRRLSLGRIGRRLALLLTFCVILIFQGAWPSLAERPQLIRVGIFQNRPIVFQDEHGVPQGLYVDLLRKIAEEEDWEIEFVPGSWGEGLKRLRSGEIDLMTSIAYTKERDEHMDFSSENVLMMWGQVYVKPDSDTQNILDLKGQKIAILKDGINGINFRKLCSGFGVNCQFVVVDTYAKVFELVAEGKVGAGVANNVHGDILARQYGIQASPILFNPFSLLFASPESKHQELLSAIDKRLAAWKRKESSFYYETLNHSFGMMSISKYSIPRWVIFTLIISGGLALLFLIWMYVLQIQVKARTTEITLREEALRESEEKYRSLFNDALDMIHIVDINGKIIDANPIELEILGYTREEYLGKPLLEIIHTDYRATTKTTLQRVMRGEEVKVYETALVTNQGEKIDVEVNVTPQIKGGKTVAARAIIRNITEHKQAEEALKESEENLRTLVQSSTDSILTLDPDRRITSYTSSFLNQFGYSREEIIGQPASMIHPSRESFDLFGQTVYPVIARKGFWRGEWKLKRKDGSIFRGETVNSAMKRSDGSLRGYVAILRDITERKRAEEELAKHREHLEEMVRERTAELQSIVNSMAGREVRMAGLKETIRKLRAQVEETGLTPVADDPLKEMSEG